MRPRTALPPSAWLDQNLGRDSQFLMEPANHLERQPPIAAQHLVNSASLANDSDELANAFPGLFQSELDGLDGAGQVDRVMFPLVCLYQRGEHVQFVSRGSSPRCTPKPLHAPQSPLVIVFRPDGFNFHIAPSSRQSYRNPRGLRSIKGLPVPDRGLQSDPPHPQSPPKAAPCPG